ncbi:alpha/beta hydrolase [uncultured Arcticibacterium sp.]|uniref:alpha/beta hydrolase n=1 Tax=uncultured Arcticibacterium sp. TaxID=2173042 RepID=UPI0030FCEA7E
MFNCISALLFILLISLQTICKGQSETEILLYPSGVPNAINIDRPEKMTFNSEGQLIALSSVLNPRLLLYRPNSPNGASVILCPGGGYRNLNIENVRFIAQRLNEMGVTAFILTYRLPADGLMVDPSIGSLQDVQQALRVVRGRASEWNLKRDKVGLWGSSAGGHLAAMAATHWNVSYEKGKDTIDLRPDFLILAWPVVTFRGTYVHKGSRRNLLGENLNEELLADFSPNEQVNVNTPPTFLVHAGEDPGVSVSNSILFYQALKENRVPAELHIYEENVHGFGVAPEVENSWMSELRHWFGKRGLE